MGSHLTVRAIRHKSDREGHWVASQVDGGYTVRCDDALLVTVNGRKPRVFRTLDSVAKKLKEEIGITSFEVETMTRG